MRLQPNPDYQGPCPRGFTLVEILAVVVIIAIAAAMVVPRLGSTGDVQAMAAMQETVANLQYAQNEAIVLQTPITVAFDANADSYVLRDANSTPLKHPITKWDFRVPFRTTRGTDQVDLMTANFNGQPAVTFDTLGAPTQGGSITLGAEGYTYRLDVAPVTGKITVTRTGL
jgi:type II secretion system protein H